jgi:L-seryl-tRNA(Ser) seleniumtransferase
LNKPFPLPLLASRDAVAALPAVDRVLSLPAVQSLMEAFGREPVQRAVRALLADQRSAILGGERFELAWPGSASWVESELRSRLEAQARSSMLRVFNLTGTVLHTNLGRAPLPPEAVQAIAAAASAPVAVELDPRTGKRGERDELVEPLLCELTGAQAATVVNNCAAAVLLVLNTLAPRKEVIVSRGELIEIGGSFRMPDIMARAGARLVEVGTTNRTHLRDYEQAIGARTALLLKVHPSNYAIQGFTASVAEGELAALAHAYELPLFVDLGSGALVDLSRHGLPPEPTPRALLAAGADLVALSGDKLMGGPQAGIVVGRRHLVERLRRNPLKRALRVDKLTLAALEAVLRLYRDPDRLRARLSTLRLLTREAGDIRRVAEHVLEPVRRALGNDAEVSLRDCQSQIGSGSLPVDRLPSVALVITPRTGRKRQGGALRALQARLAGLPVPVLGRTHGGALWLDLRCLEDEEGFLAQLTSLAPR